MYGKLDDCGTYEFRNDSCIDEGSHPGVYQELPSEALYSAIQEEQANSKQEAPLAKPHSTVCYMASPSKIL